MLARSAVRRRSRPSKHRHSLGGARRSPDMLAVKSIERSSVYRVFYLAEIVISGPGIQATVNRRLALPGESGVGSRKLI